MGQKEKNGAGEIFGSAITVLLKAILKIFLLLFVGLAKLVHTLIGMLVEFIEKRLE